MSKLTLRDLFAVVTITAILVAWWVDHRQLSWSRDVHLIEAAVSRRQLETTEKTLHNVLLELAPERVGSDFDFSIDAGGDEEIDAGGDEGEQP